MPTKQETVELIVSAMTWDERVSRFRQIPQRHGTDEHASIFAQVARQLYVPHLAPDYAYVNTADFYELPHFQDAYAKAAAATAGFADVSVARLSASIQAEPVVLLPLRVITGLTRTEFAWSTKLIADPLGLKALSPGKVDSMERSGTATSPEQARVAAETVDKIMRGVCCSVLRQGASDRNRTNRTRPVGGPARHSTPPIACPTTCSCISATMAERSGNCSMLRRSGAVISSRTPSSPSSFPAAFRSSARVPTTRRRSLRGSK